MAEAISIQKELFNPAFWILRHHMADPEIRYVYIFGGSSAAKTYSLCQQIVLDCLTKGYNTLVTRKISADMEDSIYADIKGIINEDPENGGLGLSAQFIIQAKKIICKSNGAFIRFRGMDDQEKIKGISRFQYVIMEEFSQYEEADNKQARKRLRGMENQKIIYIWNPIDELMWQKMNLIDKETWIDCSIFPHIDTKTGIRNTHEGIDGAGLAEHKINMTGDSAYIRTNYLDNWYIVGHPDGVHGFVDKHVMKDMEWDRLHDYGYYWVYGLGHWGRVDRGGEFYKNFDEKRHLKPQEDLPVNEHLAFHLSIDENVNPYLSMSVYQADGLSSWKIDEFTMRHPENTVFALAREFELRFGAWTKIPLFIYGDATSQKEDTKQEKGENFFKILAHELEAREYRTTLRVPRMNPGQIMRGAFFNAVLSERGYMGIDFVIANNLTETIKDFRYLKEAMDGRKFKKKIKHEETGVPFEELGHLSDTDDYFLCEYYKKEFDEFCRGKRARPAIVVRRKEFGDKTNVY